MTGLVVKLHTTVLASGSLPGGFLTLGRILVIISGGTGAGAELGFIVLAPAV